MKFGNRYAAAICLLLAVVLGLIHLGSSPTSAQPAAAPAGDAAGAIAQSISTQVVTLKLQDQKGEPRLTTGKAVFDRPVQAYWVALVGADIKFTGNTEKYINRELFGVDPFAKIINGKEVEVTGKLGIRDGSGNWDDSYEGTVTVAVTAILGGK